MDKRLKQEVDLIIQFKHFFLLDFQEFENMWNTNVVSCAYVVVKHGLLH